MDLPALQALARTGFDVNAIHGEDGSTALMFAAAKGQTQIVRHGENVHG